MWLILAVLACGTATSDDNEDDDFLSHEAPSEEEDTEPCTTAIWLNGRPASEAPSPQVGDSWSVLLYCDESLQTGATPNGIQIEPPDMAQVDDTNPIVTFIQAGNATISLQVGNRSASADVTIEE